MRKTPFQVREANSGIRRLGFLSAFVILAVRVFAHDPGLSVATARIQSSGLEVHLAMSPVDVQFLLPAAASHAGKTPEFSLAAAKPQLEKIALSAFAVSLGRQHLTASKVVVQCDRTGGVQIDIYYPGLTTGELTLRSTILGSLAHGHRQFLSIRSVGNEVSQEAMLDVTHDSCTAVVSADVDPTRAQHSFRDFLALGILHIATGYDHILFLLGLLITGGSLKTAVKTITAFTLAHSLTLALATLNLINIPPGIIEPLIAVSIIYVGVENIFRRNLQKRWLLAFGFGLVHGCGFATALRDLGVGSNGSSVLVPLFSFNLGVELCQMAIAALVLPLIWKLRERPHFVQRFVPVGSCAITMAGAWWLLERTLS